MIFEIVRSKANIDNGAKGFASDFFHASFLLISLALIPGVLQEIPLAALAAMLIYTGFRTDQLILFVTTMLVILVTQLGAKCGGL